MLAGEGHAKPLDGVHDAGPAGAAFDNLPVRGRFPLRLLVVVFLGAFIPVIGAPVVWLPLVGYLAFAKLYYKAAILFLLGMFVLYQAFGTLNMDSISAAFAIGASEAVVAVRRDWSAAIERLNH